MDDDVPPGFTGTGSDHGPPGLAPADDVPPGFTAKMGPGAATDTSTSTGAVAGLAAATNSNGATSRLSNSLAAHLQQAAKVCPFVDVAVRQTHTLSSPARSTNASAQARLFQCSSNAQGLSCACKPRVCFLQSCWSCDSNCSCIQMGSKNHVQCCKCLGPAVQAVVRRSAKQHTFKMRAKHTKQLKLQCPV